MEVMYLKAGFILIATILFLLVFTDMTVNLPRIIKEVVFGKKKNVSNLPHK